MPIARTLLSAGALLFAAMTVAPLVAASPDNVYACVGYKEGMCEGHALLVVVEGQHVDACVIGVQGSCDPYEGHLVRAHVNDDEYVVRDPCYTMACW